MTISGEIKLFKMRLKLGEAFTEDDVRRLLEIIDELVEDLAEAELVY